MHERPTLYLDIDDTLVSYARGWPEGAPGVGSFLRWALRRYHVRWLTTWCPTGRMPGPLARDLASMTGLGAARLCRIRGYDWEDSGSKLNGIAWLDHVVLDRPFLWIEDDFGVGERERRFLADHGFADSFRCCNVTRDPGALRRLHAELRAQDGGC